MAAKLYSIPGSHPVVAVRRMLELKGVDYERVDLLPVFSHGILRALRFPAATVPALKLDDGTKVSGSREIARDLDRLHPDPPLFPADAEQRDRVEEAEAWGESELQDAVRRLLWAAASANPKSTMTFAAGAKLPLPTPVARASAGAIVAIERRMWSVDEASTRADLAAWPGWIDRIDALIADGTLADPADAAAISRPNAADLQIGSSIRLAICMEDFRDELLARPAGRHAKELLPDYPGRVPAALAKYR